MLRSKRTKREKQRMHTTYHDGYLKSERSRFLCSLLQKTLNPQLKRLENPFSFCCLPKTRIDFVHLTKGPKHSVLGATEVGDDATCS